MRACNRGARTAHCPGTRLVLVGLVLCACGGAPAVAVENRGGSASASCELPARLDFDARHYASRERAHRDYQVWTPWRVGIQLRADATATVTMLDDTTVITFEARVHRDGCTLELASLAPASLGPYALAIDLTARTGRVRTETRDWLLGPPFPEPRP